MTRVSATSSPTKLRSLAPEVAGAPGARLTQADGLILAGLALLVGLYAIAYFDFSVPPAEDAAILMRYAQHLAEGYGIVWNVGEAPVDGATDFLFMAVLAALVRGGLSVEAAARAVGLGSHLLAVLLVYAAIRSLSGSSRWIAVVSAVYLAIGPGLGYVEAYFGTPFFALFATITWYLASKIARDGATPDASWAFSLAGLATGLIRPEGVLLAGFMLLAVVYYRGFWEARRVVLCFLALFGIAGGLYFAWRWSYFGYPLPNPFYKKGGGALYPLSLQEAIANAIFLCLPFAPAFLLGLRTAPRARQTVFVLIPVVGFTAIWVLLSNEMNYLMRFQYAILPMVLIAWPQLVQGIRRDWRLPDLGELDRRNRLVLVLLVEILALAVLAYQYEQWAGSGHPRDGRYDVAVMLSEYRSRGYTMATTEAGLLPLYSGWRAIDTWGLNDRWIALNGAITEEYLDRFRPEVVVFHAYDSPIAAPEQRNAWSSMVLTLKGYAQKHGYTLAAAYGDSPRDTHYYYVRTDFPDGAEILRKIRNLDYFWYENGRKSTNYALLRPS